MRQAVYALLLIATFLISSASAADTFIKAEHVTFAGLEAFAQVVKRTVACVQVEGNDTDNDNDNDWTPLGTAFLVQESDTVYAITCNHVITNALEAKKPIYIAIETNKKFHRAPCKVLLQDPDNDIAILFPTKPQKDTIAITNMIFSLDDFADASILVEGRAVIIPGYPLGIGASIDENHPVVRFGIIAQHTGKPFFLIDGIASPGNSGSPVYGLKDKKIAGMITSYLPDYISLKNDQGQVAARLPYNSGLGRAVTAVEIKKALLTAIGK